MGRKQDSFSSSMNTFMTLRKKCGQYQREFTQAAAWTDHDIRAFWIAAGQVGYPYGPLFKLFFAGGERLPDWIEAKREQFDLDAKVFLLPRRKSFRHEVPLSDLMIEIITALPGFPGADGGGFVFSHNGGASPIVCVSSGKRRLDRLMQQQLKDVAVAEESTRAVAPNSWGIHGLRRIVHARLYKLNIDPQIIDAVLGRERQRIDHICVTGRTEQQREALQAWADEIRRIVGVEN